MAALRSFGPALRSFTVASSRNTKWSGQASGSTVVSFPNREASTLAKNKTLVEEIKALRFTTAVKTPYLPDGRIDLDSYDLLVDLQIANGCEGIIVGGTTGEGQLLSWVDHVALIDHTVSCFGSRTKVIGNTGTNATGEAIKHSEQGYALGMHAAMHINPYYGKTSSAGLLAHYKNLLDAGPVVVYNVPSRTGQDIPPEVVLELAEHPNFTGIKECLGQMDRIDYYTSRGIVVWTGNDEECHEVRYEHGGTGVMSVASNLVPGLLRELMFEGKNPVLNAKLSKLCDWLFLEEPNPICLNTALAQLGLIKPVFRLPFVPAPEEKRVRFVNLVKELGREMFIGDKDVRVMEDDEFIVVERYND